MFTNSVISGYCDVYESMGENANIKVVASGPYGKTFTQTGEGGHYVITGLGNGTYRLDFTKEGYGTIKMYNIQLFGNDTVNVSQVSLFKRYDKFVMPSLSNISVETNQRFGPNPVVIIETDMSSSTGALPSPLPVVLFTDSIKNVSYINYTCVHPFIYPAFDDSGSGKIVFTFDPGYLPFKSGSEVFFIGYVCNPNEINNGYFDKYLGFDELSTLIPEKHSQVMSFIMP